MQTPIKSYSQNGYINIKVDIRAKKILRDKEEHFIKKNQFTKKT